MTRTATPWSAAPTSTSAESPDTPATGRQRSAARSENDTWVVGQGDSFWSVAEETLADRASGVTPANGEVERYWRALVATNRTQMADPDNPDLLIPGQELALPPT